MGSKRASPRLSLVPASAAMSASCWTAKAGSTEPKVAKTAPAIAGAVIIGLKPIGSFEFERPSGESEMGLEVGFGDGLVVLLVLRVKHFVLSTAIVVAIVAAIFYDGFWREKMIRK